MTNAPLYTRLHCANPGMAGDPQDVPWDRDLPPGLQAFVVRPTRFDEQRDYEITARHTRGHDAALSPCYSDYHYVRTQLRCDDDEVYYEAPVYAESLTAWRLLDSRWLVRRWVLDGFDCKPAQATYAISDRMPR